MLSLIICSRNISISNKLDENIKETILVDYELIIIDNSSNQLSLFEAYNIGINRSKGQILVFLHDDILFQTMGWGKIIHLLFEQDSDIGLIGIAGSSVKTKMPSTWWEGPIYIRIIQHHKNDKASENKNQGFRYKDIVEVAAIDGVLMIMKRNNNIKFDENLRGYHNYDLDLSLKHHKINKKVCVTNQIVIEHFSGGTINKDWYLSTSKFHKLNSENLPIITDTRIDSRNLRNIEFQAGAGFVFGLLEYDLKMEALYWWLKLIKMKFYSKFHFKFLKKILVLLIKNKKNVAVSKLF